jgi:hypothetical protein
MEFLLRVKEGEMETQIRFRKHVLSTAPYKAHIITPFQEEVKKAEKNSTT